MYVRNFAKADSVDAAHAALMENVTQRANILSPDANQVGVGVLAETTGTGVLVTQIFVRAATRADTSAIAKKLRAELPRYQLKRDTDLDGIAQTFANALAAGRRADDIWPDVRSRIHEIDRRYEKINYSVTTTFDASTISASSIFGAQQPAMRIGVGVSQSADRDVGYGPLSIVLVIGVPR